MLSFIQKDSVKERAQLLTKYSQFLSHGHAFLHEPCNFPSNQQYLELLAQSAGFNTYAAFKMAADEMVEAKVDRKLLEGLFEKLNPHLSSFDELRPEWNNCLYAALKEVVACSLEDMTLLKHMVAADRNIVFLTTVLLALSKTTGTTGLSQGPMHSFNTASNIFSKARCDFDASGVRYHIILLRDIYAKKVDQEEFELIKTLILDPLLEMGIYKYFAVESFNLENPLDTEIVFELNDAYKQFYADRDVVESSERILKDVAWTHLKTKTDFELAQSYHTGYDEDGVLKYQDIVDNAVEMVQKSQLPNLRVFYERNPSIQAMFEKELQAQLKDCTLANNMDHFEQMADEVEFVYKNDLVADNLAKIEKNIQLFKDAFKPSLRGYAFDLRLRIANPHMELVEALKEGMGKDFDFKNFSDDEVPNKDLLECKIYVYSTAHGEKKYVGFLEYDHENRVFFYIIPGNLDEDEPAFEYIEEYLTQSYMSKTKGSAKESAKRYVHDPREIAIQQLNGRYTHQLNEDEFTTLKDMQRKGRKLGLKLTVTKYSAKTNQPISVYEGFDFPAKGNFLYKIDLRRVTQA